MSDAIPDNVREWARYTFACMRSVNDLVAEDIEVAMLKASCMVTRPAPVAMSPDDAARLEEIIKYREMRGGETMLSSDDSGFLLRLLDAAQLNAALDGAQRVIKIQARLTADNAALRERIREAVGPASDATAHRVLNALDARS